MATTLATARTSMLTALAGITTAEKYRRRMTGIQYPCFIAGWPDEIDFNADLGGADRDFTIPLWVGVEVTDDESSDDLLSSLMESAVTALQAYSSAWSVRPATNFGTEAVADDRTIIWAALPVVMYS